MPAVSVVIPFYDVEAELEACVRSVLDQDLADIEILLVDDASRDGSRDIAERLAARDDRIGLIAHAENRGLGPARNTGVRHARGRYLFFLDSDDTLASATVLRDLVHDAGRSGCPVVVGACAQMAPGGTIRDHDRRLDGLEPGHPGMAVGLPDALSGVLGLRGAPYLPMRAWGTLIDHACYRRAGLDFPPGEHEDMAHTPFLYAMAGRIFYDRRVAVLYRMRASSLSNAGWSAAKLHRYAELWRETAARAARFGLDDERGNFAALFAWHLSWKIRANGLDPGAEAAFAAVLGEILGAVDGRTDRKRIFDAVDALKGFPAGHDAAASRMLVGALPEPVMLDYYRRRLGLGRRSLWRRRTRPAAFAAAAIRRAEEAMEAGSGVTDALLECDTCLGVAGDRPGRARSAARSHRLLHWLTPRMRYRSRVP